MTLVSPFMTDSCYGHQPSPRRAATLAKKCGPLPEPARPHIYRQWLLKRIRSVHRARATDGAADLRAIERFIDDLANGASAPPALCAAAKTAIHMARRPVRGGTRSGSHFLVAQYVAGTDNHQAPLFRYSLPGACGRVKIKLLFTNVLNYCVRTSFCPAEDRRTTMIQF